MLDLKTMWLGVPSPPCLWQKAPAQHGHRFWLKRHQANITFIPLQHRQSSSWHIHQCRLTERLATMAE